jgi:hypothetical protein
MSCLYPSQMIDCRVLPPFRLRARPAAMLFMTSLILCGCANMGDTMSSAFVDPAKYNQFDCKQLEAERKNLGVRTAELQGLIAKADTGAGGAVVAELAYRNDYISTRAALKLANEVWQRDKCVSGAPASTPPGAALTAPAKDPGAAVRSHSAIY